MVCVLCDLRQRQRAFWSGVERARIDVRILLYWLGMGWSLHDLFALFLRLKYTPI